MNEKRRKISFILPTCGQSANYPRAANAGVHDRDDVSKLALERRVEVGAALDCSQAVAVCQFGEDADVAVVLELET
jgi:hypothetical protein